MRWAVKNSWLLLIHFINYIFMLCCHFYPCWDESALNGISHRSDIRPCRTIKRHLIPFLRYFCSTSTPICHMVLQSAEQPASPISFPSAYAPTPRISKFFLSSHSALLHSALYKLSKSGCRKWVLYNTFVHQPPNPTSQSHDCCKENLMPCN